MTVPQIPLRHGVFLAPFHAMDVNPTLAFERDLELCRHLDDLGFDEVWVGEHHSAGMETIDSPELFIAAAAERTKHIRFGTGVISVPYHHPFHIAARLVQLDHMTRGRVAFGFGPGLLASDALMLGIEPEATRERLGEGLDVILRLLRGEVVSASTEWFTLQDARLHLLPYTRPHPEICITSAVTPSGGRLAGQHGLGMLCVAAGEGAGFDALATNWEVANQVAAADGRTMDRSGLRCVVNLHLADTREQAIENIRFGCKDFIDYFNNNLPRFSIPAGADTVDWVVEHKIAVVGTPDDAIERIEALYAKQGEFGALLIQAHNWADWEATKRSYELYARYVMPHFDGANAARQASYASVTASQSMLVDKRNAAAQQAFDRHAALQAADGLATGDRGSGASATLS
jgi:limonene 1,2-monooxygenase